MEHRSSQRRISRWWILVGSIVLMVGIVYAWRLQAQAPAAPVVPQRGPSRLPQLSVLSEATDNEAKDMGGTFYFLESHARKVTTRFADGTAIAERSMDGNIKTKSTDSAGNELARLTVDQVSANDAEMLYESNGTRLFSAAVRPECDRRSTGGAQAQALRDGHPAAVQWRGCSPARRASGQATWTMAAEVVTSSSRTSQPGRCAWFPSRAKNARPR